MVWKSGEKRHRARRRWVAGVLAGIGLGAAIRFALRRSGRVTSASPAPSSRDIVDIASEESFPASDAPAY